MYHGANEQMSQIPLIVGTRRHSTLLSSLSSSFRLGTPKPANPLSLKLMESAAYPRNGRRQTHCAYLAYFQQFNLEKRPLFSKRIVKGFEPRCLRRNRYAVPCSTLHFGVTCQPAGCENIPTMEAGMWFGIRRLIGKRHAALESKLIDYNAPSHPPGRTSRMPGLGRHHFGTQLSDGRAEWTVLKSAG